MKIALVAGEESGDRLGGALMRALSARRVDIKYVGVGGHEMAEAGLHSLFPFDELSIIGFTQILRRYFAIRRRIAETADAVVAASPDVLVIIDSPEFTHRVARRVRAAAPHIPIVNYVSPSVWAWRPWRAKAMRGYVDHVLALLPFEPGVHERLGGPPCTYVGHPLTEEAGELRPGPEDIKRRNSPPPLLVVLPGSRRAEISRLLPIFGRAIEILRHSFGEFELVLPTVPRLESAVRDGVAFWPLRPHVAVEARDRRAAFRMARAALAKSGTVTLELALSGVPMIAAYKAPVIEEVLVRSLIQVDTLILTNLVLGQNIVPQYVQRDCTPEKLAAALLPLLRDGPEREAQVRAFARLDGIMHTGGIAPSERAADVVLGFAARKRS